ncbi:MAG TPA: penicillin-binding transpeptidase domain-containing protein [Anaerolineaceae bacterium]|jgi:penicillin-binding protein 2
MMKTSRYLSFLMLISLTGCAVLGKTTAAAPTPSPTHAPPTAGVTIVPAPDAKAAAMAFLNDWKAENYASMYARLTKVSQDAISAVDFAARYKDAAKNLTLKQIEPSVVSSLTTPESAQVAYQVIYHTNVVGDLTRQMTMNLARDGKDWKVQWEDGLIMPELKGGNKLVMNVTVPSRGNIYDRSGEAIASQTDAVAISLHTGELVAGQEGTLLSELSRLTGKTAESIRALYAYPVSIGQNWPVVVGEAPAADVDSRMSVLSGLGGVYLDKYRNRYYPDGGIAPHAVGYVSAIYKEDLEQYARLGYRGDETVGRDGIEKWGENYLAGTRGASLHVVDPQGQIVTMLAETEAQPADSIYTTLDYNLQAQTQKAISGFNAAAVVVERDTGRVLAMASSPSFDPNLLVPNNPNAGQSQTVGDYNNRAAMGQYPLGSVFKIITMSAALESGVYAANSTFDCQQSWTSDELPGTVLTDWTKEYGVPASGMLNLPEGLMRSCDPWFYQIGLGLYDQMGADYVAKLARAFGLGSRTGIGDSGIGDAAGNVQDPVEKIDAVQMAIGQYTLLVTPLQVADFVAAVGNGGTLYKPQLIEKIAPLDGSPIFTFKPVANGKLPVTPANLKIVQDAMRTVISDTRGTAHYVFSGMQIPIYGKTGTAQSDKEKPHAWFAAYTDAKRPDKPDIAVVVVAEYAGEGSDFAAPMVRRILEVYFTGQPQKLYSWEASYNVTRTPTPEFTNTPVPVPPTDTPVPADTPQVTDTPTP